MFNKNENQNENKNLQAGSANDAAVNTKVSAKIQETWNQLSPEDVKLYASNRGQFFSKLQEKQNVSKADAEKRIMEIEKSCGCATGETNVGAGKDGYAKIA